VISGAPAKGNYQVTIEVRDAPARSQTLDQILRERARHSPQRVLYTFLKDGEEEELVLTYGELDQQARRIAGWLQSIGASDERVLLLYPPGLDFIAAFFGCLYAGAVAVPSYPPKLNRKPARFQAIAADAQATVALTTQTILSRVKNSPEFARLEWRATDNLEDSWITQFKERALDHDATAFIQYTSGSTSTPKGVIVSHDNLRHNEQMIQEAFGQTEHSVIVGWLPLYHDMGLIGNVLQPLSIGAQCVLLSPLAFLQRPYRWLKAISRYRGTTSGGPNFAYDLCVRKISPAERATLDLSSWYVAFNGSETVRAETVERFTRTFAACGFRRDAFYPCYGLAEATLLVSARSKTSGPQAKTLQARALQEHCVVEAAEHEEGAQAAVSCGALVQTVRIVDPDTLTPCVHGRIGEIWVAGPSVASGYWNRPHETEETFYGYLIDTDEGPFLRTGDLGFLSDGELFVTGRLKDLIIIRGLNHYPQDLEATAASCHPALSPSATVAFSVEADGAEQLVIVTEVERGRHVDTQAIIAAIRNVIAEQHELNVSTVLLVKPGSVLRTSSGKLQRQACRAAFLSGAFEPVAEYRANEPATLNDQPAETLTNANSLQERLASMLAQTTGIEPGRIDVHEPLTRCGLDSLTAVELAHSIESQTGLVVPLNELLRGSSIAELLNTVQVASDETLAPLNAKQEQELSPGQHALWFLHQLAPESPAYNLMGAVRIRGDLNVRALQRAFQSLVDRHDSLRSSFRRSGTQPVRIIAAHRELFFEEVDASVWSQTALDERLVAEAHRPFDLENDALLRVWVFKRSEEDHVVLLTLHHIIADFWSLAVLVHELGILYNSDGVSLEPLPLSYGDFVAWQTKRLAQDQDKLWQFWQHELSGTLPVLNLSTDKPRPHIQTFRGSSYRFSLRKELTDRLVALGEAHNATLYMTLLATFQLLLHRYTGQEEILVGTPTAGRSRADLSGIIGYFVNMLVMRADCSNDPTFVDFLDQVRDRALAVLAHEDYPFPLLVERLQPLRTGDRSPLVQVVLVLQKSTMNEQGLSAFALGEAGARMTLGKLSLESVPLEQRIAMFDLTLMFAEVDDRLEASLQYNTDLFNEKTIARMASHFQTLVENLANTPEQRLSMVPLMAAWEQRELLAEWNRIDASRSQSDCLHRTFEAQAARTPDAVALTCELEDLSYRELNRRANLLAHHLRSLGCRPEMLVGVCLERSSNLLVAILGVLKAGAAYVPLDPSYPVERIDFMLQDSGVSLLVTEQQLRLPVHATPVINLDVDWSMIAEGSEENPVVEMDGDHAAYVIYTSGSTGKPKGSVICHAQVARLFTSTEDWFHFTSHDVWTLFHSPSFDFSVWEIWGALLYGGRLVIVPHLISRAPEAFYQLLVKEHVTVLNQTPSAFQSLIEAEAKHQDQNALSLRLVIFGGEALNLQRLGPWIQRHGDKRPRLVNMYGITETTVHVTYKAIESDDLNRGASLIGRPIPDLQVYVLDQSLNPVPHGVAGELFVGGAGLARGYLHRPDLTAERFLPHPFDTRPGARLYRTGDMGRYLDKGEIEYLGRVDQQVKVRGYRIELGEIEAVLLEHPSVRQAAILIREDTRGDKKLIAYLVFHPGSAMIVGELQMHARRKLPAYMVPAELIKIDELPLTPSGKLNRRALPEPEHLRPDLQVPFVAPSTPIEEALADIWSEVLDVKRVGVHDSFFELGGHSLLATQLISRAEDALGVKIPLRTLFEGPTVSNLALHILHSQLSEIHDDDLTQLLAEFELVSENGSDLHVSGGEKS
jgi:amino acid adenylation domain-containing protein